MRTTFGHILPTHHQAPKTIQLQVDLPRTLHQPTRSGCPTTSENRNHHLTNNISTKALPRGSSVPIPRTAPYPMPAEPISSLRRTVPINQPLPASFPLQHRPSYLPSHLLISPISQSPSQGVARSRFPRSAPPTRPRPPTWPTYSTPSQRKRWP